MLFVRSARCRLVKAGAKGRWLKTRPAETLLRPWLDGSVDNLWLYLVIGLVVLILVAGFAFSLIRGRGTDVLEREAPGRAGKVEHSIDHAIA